MRGYVFILLGLVGVQAYQLELHPEYQQGLAINDVPAARRNHWMRVANEVSIWICKLIAGGVR